MRFPKSWLSVLFVPALLACDGQQAQAPAVTAATPQSSVPATPAEELRPAPVTPLAEIPESVQAAKDSTDVACYVDTLNGAGASGQGTRRSLQRSDGFNLQGWAVDRTESAGAPQPPVLIVLTPEGADGKAIAFNATRHARPDVSAAPEFASIRPESAGVMLDARMDGVEPGTYRLQYVIGEGATARRCDMSALWTIELT
jgi:hypothetical protein